MIDVACAADDGYLPHAAAMVHSLLTSNPPAGVRVHLLHPPELGRRSRRELQAMVSGLGSSLAFHEVAAATVTGLPEMGRISRVMWHRLVLPVALPDALRVLYLDCDVLVRRPLAPLWELDLGGCALGAVTNVFPPYLAHRPDALGLPRASYFNSGVLLLDLDAWRTRGESERIAAIVRAGPERLVFPDQDALNLALWRDRLPLHPRWNCQNAILYFRTAEELLGAAAAADARADPAILHFEGGAWAKPWHYLSDHPFRQTYLDHRAQTPWPQVRMEGRTAANVLRRRLPPRARAVLSHVARPRERRPLARSGGEPVNTDPLVSIVVPSYNMGRFLPETLDSIFAQDYRPLEVIVVDGASRDETVAILRRAAAEHPELRWTSEPDDGPEEAINKGLAMVNGEIAAVQSADDIYYPGALRAAVDGFARHPEAGIVYGDAKMIDADGRHVSGPTRYLPWSLERYLVGSTFIPQSSAFFRPKAARSVGGVRKRYFVFDVDLWLRMALSGVQPVKIPGVLSAYRHHDAQRDKEAAEILGSYRRLLADTRELHERRLHTRLAAFAGWRMLTQHYNPTDNPRYVAGQMWLAMLAYPPAARAVVKPRALIPPWPTWRGALRRLGLSPSP